MRRGCDLQTFSCSAGIFSRFVIASLEKLKRLVSVVSGQAAKVTGGTIQTGPESPEQQRQEDACGNNGHCKVNDFCEIYGGCDWVTSHSCVLDEFKCVC